MVRHYLIFNGDPSQYQKKLKAYQDAFNDWRNKHGKKIALKLSELPPCEPSKVERIQNGYALHVYPNPMNCYYIDERVSTMAELVAWIRCLSEKTWFDGSLCYDFIQAVAESNRWILPNYFD